MDEEYMDTQESSMNDVNRASDQSDIVETAKDFGEGAGYEDFDDDENGGGFRGSRGRGNFRGRGRGPPPGWMNGPPPMRFRGRGYGPSGPPMRGRGFFRGRGGPRFGPNNGPNFDANWGPMGPPPPGMMGGPPPFGPPPGMMPPGGPMGPPPNMMGQPPPFGGPPGMPPPNMPAPELWVETKSDEGKSYYYHSRTRETTWTRPQEGPTCKVITQAEMEAMANTGQMPGLGGPQSMPMSGPGMGPPMGGPPMGMMANGMMGAMMGGVQGGPAQGAVPPFMTPPPWVKDGAATQLPPALGNVGLGMSGSGPAAAELSSAVEPAPAKKDDTSPKQAGSGQAVELAEATARAAEWSTHRAPDGRPYYYHAGRQESVWEKPKPIRELEELQAKLSVEKGNKPEKKIIEIDDSKIEVIDVEAHAEAAAAAAAAATATAERERAERERAERERAEREKADRERAEREKADKEKAEKEKAKANKILPKFSTPILGTPWLVVWTGDGHVFFYNPTACSSVWERPAQLAGRADVDKAVSQPPLALLDIQRKEAAANSTGAEGKSTNGELKRGADTDSDDSEPEPAKKTKPDEPSTTTTKRAAGNIDVGAEAAIEAEIRAARERAVVPFEQRVRSFLQMLHESEVSAFSPWEKELHKIVFDSRYLLLNSKERKQVFDKYVRERAEEERKEKKNRLQQKKLSFRALMEEAKLHSKSSYTDFASKYSREERFKAIDKVRDRETYFNEYIGEVRKREKEEKDRKREQMKTDFIALLKEKAVDRHARWVDAKKKVDLDPRYKAVESSTMREDYFREYCKMVKEERKKEKDGKEKERERKSKKEKKDKDRDKEKDKDKDKDKDKEKEKEKDGKEGKEKKKKEKAGEKPEPTVEEKKQPTPPPDQWAEILGIPGEEEKLAKKTKAKKEVEKEEIKSRSTTPEKQVSPKQLRSSKKELPTPEKKSPIKSPPKKRKEFKSPEPEQEKKGKKKTEKTEKKKRKKSEKD